MLLENTIGMSTEIKFVTLYVFESRIKYLRSLTLYSFILHVSITSILSKDGDETKKKRMKAK